MQPRYVNTAGLVQITGVPPGSVSSLDDLGLRPALPDGPGRGHLWSMAQVVGLAVARGARAYGCNQEGAVRIMAYLWDKIDLELERLITDGRRYVLVVAGKLIAGRPLTAEEIKDPDGGTEGLKAAYLVGMQPLVIDLALVVARVREEMDRLAVDKAEGSPEARRRIKAAREGQTCKS